MSVIAINQLLNRQQEPQQEAVPCRRHHRVLPIDEDNHAIQVMAALHAEGYEAYLVGGAVRDCLLGIPPKDFDVVTNATPVQVCQVFPNSNIVGKRFPIVHVILGGERIEVSTFRSGTAEQNGLGRVTLDNDYGTIEQDVWRRDFTCNALYYDFANKEILDFHGGVEHIAKKRLVMIGKPQKRYAEDPVRILRAIRFANKLGFTLDEAMVEAVAAHAPLLANEPKARVAEEILKMLSSGQASGCLKQFDELGIKTRDVHPLLTVWHERQHHKMVQDALQENDRKVADGQQPSNVLFLAALFWHELTIKSRYLIEQGTHPIHVMEKLLPAYQNKLSSNFWRLPEPLLQELMAVCRLQPMLDSASPKTGMTTFRQPHFQAAYDWFLRRATYGEAELKKVQWWQLFRKMNGTEPNGQHDTTGLYPEIALPAACEVLSRIAQSGDAVQRLHHEAKMCQEDDAVMSLLTHLLKYEHDVLLHEVLLECDRQVQNGRVLPLSSLLAAVFWPLVQEKRQDYLQNGRDAHQSLLSAIQICGIRLYHEWQIRTGMTLITREIWSLQHEFANMSGKAPFILTGKSCFNEAFFLYRLRRQKGEVSLQDETWWTTFVAAAPDMRDKMAFGKQTKSRQKPHHSAKPKNRF